MKNQAVFLDFLLKEWLLLASVAGLLVSSVHLQRIPSFTGQDVQFLLTLTALFVTVKGLERSGLMTRLSRPLRNGRGVPLKLVVATFVLSMLVTNDVALLVIVPLTLALDTTRKDLLVILEALAANAGSALTPFGNPQNLFIYWSYGLHPGEFVAAIAPLAVVSLIVLALASLAIRVTVGPEPDSGATQPGSRALVYTGFLIALILVVLHVLPVWVGAVVIGFALVLDRGSLRIDLSLLLTFVCFFGLADNMKVLFEAAIEHSGHVFILSALTSQVISNVPAALLFAKFTTQWKALLWGTNVGGFGSLIASLANLIAYRLYVTHESTGDIMSFTLRFTVLGYVAFFLGLGLYGCMESGCP